MGRICRKGRFSVWNEIKEIVGDEKLTMISVTVSGINEHIRFYSTVKCFAQLPSAPLTRYEHRPVPPNANPAV